MSRTKSAENSFGAGDITSERSSQIPTSWDAGWWGVRSWLYVPGDRPDRFESALNSGADAVVVDLEDGVAPSHKEAARDAVVAWLEEVSDGPRIVVRINAIGEGGLEDLVHLPMASVDALRIPKVESPDDVNAVAEVLDLECQTRLLPIIESCIGLERANSIAFAHSLVAGISLGEGDLISELGTNYGPTLDWARVQVIVSARAAKLPSPAQGVYPWPHDVEGLREDSMRGRQLGFFGRSAIHPAQVPVINEVFGPTANELSRAESLLEKLDEFRGNGVGAFLDEEGKFVDAAMIAGARLTVTRAGGSVLKAR